MSFSRKSKVVPEGDGWATMSMRKPVVMLTRNQVVPTSSTYVVPSQRLSAPKSFDEEFPSLGGAAPKTMVVAEPKKSFSTLMKERVEKDSAEQARTDFLNKAKNALDVDTLSIARDLIGIPSLGRYLRARKARELEESRRRHRIFDSPPKEEEEYEPPSPPVEFDDGEGGADEVEGEADAYDADDYDRHR